MEIVRTHTYIRALRRLHAGPDDIDALENALAANPECGALIPGGAGLRKARFRLAGRGKRGGGRAIYFLVLRTRIYMVAAYSKTQQADLTPAELKLLSALVRDVKAAAGDG